MSTAPDALLAAFDLHQRGDLAAAEQAYLQILQGDPQHADALHLLGVVALQTGRAGDAVEFISAAIRVQSGRAVFHRNLGAAYRVLGKLDDARACFRSAIQLEPLTPQPYFELALAELAAGDLTAAEAGFRKVISLAPESADAHQGVGNVLKKRGQLDAAQASYERALELKPDSFDILLGLCSVLRLAGRYERARELLFRAVLLRPESAEAQFQWGNLEATCENWTAAVERYRQALRLNANYLEAHAALGVALQAEHKPDDALAHYLKAVELAPNHVQAHYNIGTILWERDQKTEAVEHFETAVRLKPDYAAAHINLGACYQQFGDPDRALTHYERALESEPDAAEAHGNRGLILLTKGELAEGWREYLWRLKISGYPVQGFSQPLWDGSPLAGKTLLVHAEQGLGDSLHFIRYLPILERHCADGKLVVQVHTAVVKILRQSGFTQVLGREEPLPHFDIQVPLLNVPSLLGVSLSNIPADIPYLFSTDAAIAAWREKLSHIGGLRVGITWKGSSYNDLDHLRSIPLAAFEPLAKIEGVTLVSLQKHEGLEQLREAPFSVHEIADDWDEAAGPFVDTAAIMKNLDLIVTADTATAHLAGGLGVPVWVALPTRGDWRWMRDRSDSPWYPTMRLFRQSQSGDWSGPFAKIAEALRDFRGNA